MTRKEKYFPCCNGIFFAGHSANFAIVFANCCWVVFGCRFKSSVNEKIFYKYAFFNPNPFISPSSNATAQKKTNVLPFQKMNRQLSDPRTPPPSCSSLTATSSISIANNGDPLEHTSPVPVPMSTSMTVGGVGIAVKKVSDDATGLNANAAANGFVPPGKFLLTEEPAFRVPLLLDHSRFVILAYSVLCMTVSAKNAKQFLHDQKFSV